MKERFQQFMAGRYGMDSLGVTLLVLALFLVGPSYLAIPGLILLGYAIFRMLSKNTTRRFSELQKHDQIMRSVALFFRPVWQFMMNAAFRIVQKARFLKRRWNERKEFMYISCVKCKKKLRLPRNKGKLMVSCPVCGNEFIKKT
jgi:ribosomal protein S27E